MIRGGWKSRLANPFGGAVLLVFLWAGQPTMSQNPPTIFTYDMDGSSTTSRTLMASLAGVVARTSPEVHMAYRTSTPLSDPEFWLDRHVENNPGTSVVWQSNPLWFIDRYKSHLSGYVVYDSQTINQATSVAGALGALMVEQSQLNGPIGPALASAGLVQVEDVRGKSSDWAYDTYRTAYNKDFLYRQQANKPYQLRSHAIKNAGFMFDETAATRDRYLAGQNPHSAVVGWGYNNDEFEFFSSASDANLSSVPADFLQSGASLSGWSVSPPQQASHAAANTPTEPDAHYVAFVMSDGDNVQWLSNDYATSDRWFGSPHRGSFPMNFDITPALADFNPTALKYFYAEAANDAEKTYFVNAGGYGINYPSRVSDVEGYVDRTVAAMQAADQRIISILDVEYDQEKLNALAARPEIQGVMFKTNWDAYAGNDGAIYWHQGTPVASVRHTLWDGFDTPNSLIATLNSAPRDPLNNTASYSIVNVHPWSTGTAGGGLGDPMSNVHHIVQNLDPNVRVVTLDEFFVHLANNRSTLDPSRVGIDLVSNGDFEALDGGFPPRPLNWNYAAGSATSLVTTDDSSGPGANSAAINTANADWRSDEFDAAGGEDFLLLFDFKFVDVAAAADGFRVDARFFSGPQGAGGSFVGETTAFLAAGDYEAGEWHTLAVQGVVPGGATIGDVRASTYFGPFGSGQVRIDNVRLLDSAVLPGDYNRDGQVSLADYPVWRDSLNSVVAPGAVADGNRDGVVDLADWQVWRSALGVEVLSPSSSAASQPVPEPTSMLLMIKALVLRYLCHHPAWLLGKRTP